MQPHVYAVIMAGGVGSRFWPRSRERSPKQFQEILGSGTMIQNTQQRISPLVDAEHTLIVTNRQHRELVLSQLPGIPKQNVLGEPVGRNTAPCIALAAQWIRREDPDAVMVVLPSDHLIRTPEVFLKALERGIHVAREQDALVTIGINPTHPETGYGYIQFNDAPANNPYHADGVYRVRTFAEKPNYETAMRFLKSGDFLWNSGMFVWKASVILEELRRHMPEMCEQLSHVAPAMGTPEFDAALELAYGVIRGTSIDYGVMEKASNVFVVRGEFGWSDVGSWDEVVRLTPLDDQGNVHKGTVVSRDASGNYVDAGDRVVATIGVDDLIVVATDDAVLVCRKGRSQDVKEIVDYLRRKQMNDLL